MTLFLNNDEIANVLQPGDFIDVLDMAYQDYARGNGVSVPRLDIQASPGIEGAVYQLGLVAGTVGPRYAALRIKSDMIFQRIVDGRPRKEKYCVEPGKFMGLLLLFDIQTGALLAIMHDGLIQKMRVGADSALGVRLLSRPDASVLGILGAGGMAKTHLDAIRLVRNLSEVRVFSPTRDNRETFAKTARDSGLNAIAVDTPEAVFQGSDLIAACTNAIGPVVPGALLSPGMHVTCIGGTLDQAASDKIDIGLRFGNASVPIERPDWDYREECISYAAGGVKAAHGGTRTFANIAPKAQLLLSELLANPGRGRTKEQQITFSERGNIHGVEFAAVTGLIYEKAVSAGIGRNIPTEDFLETIRN